MVERVALVTGAGRGLGRIIASELARTGVLVALNDVDSHSCASLADSLSSDGYRCFAVPADVSKSEQVQAMIDTIEERAGRLDWLVNNAALYIRQSIPFWQTSVQDWDRVVGASLSSVFLCSKYAAPIMVREGYGRIINIGSQAGVSYVPWQGPHYHAAKAGVAHLTQVMAVELAPHGVTVNCLAPTAVLTSESQQRLALNPSLKDVVLKYIPMGRYAEPTEIAAVVKFFLSDDAAYITGQTLSVNGGVIGYGIRGEEQTPAEPSPGYQESSG